eukprot:TRINITY_DN22171_c0_g1_i2.p1 TRINITY_DN22171_c0_g1~~TRINITY_DN22171_c0_g1_i2.p1  ORF type:complete len:894 (+),score=111.10 TRINITY_DN22171_c0_g1_i2:401-2683(+)
MAFGAQLSEPAALSVPQRRTVRISAHDGSRKTTGTMDEEAAPVRGDCEGSLRRPWLPILTEDEERGGRWHSCCLRSFLTLEDPSRSLAGKLVTSVVMATVVISNVAFVLESMPTFRERPAECAERRRNGLPLTVTACEPRPLQEFHTIEQTCIIVFTVDYVLRLALAHSDAREGMSSWYRTLRHIRSPLNIVDLLAVAPYYMNVTFKGMSLSFVRVLRLLRILRLLKVSKHVTSLRIFVKVTILSGQPLMMLLFFNLILVVVFGALIFVSEGQQYSVAPAFTQPFTDACGSVSAALYPTGVYVRLDKHLEVEEPTPFRSIPHGAWWVCTTMTTVGYGDMSPTSISGKTIGCICFYFGILFLALPIGVLSKNFERVYEESGYYKLVFFKHRAKRSQQARTPRRADHGEYWIPRHQRCAGRIFSVMDDPAGSKLGWLVSSFMMMTIMVSTAALIVESMPSWNSTPTSCSVGHATLEDCKPRPAPLFWWIEFSCVIIFTVDYILRVTTVNAAMPVEGLEKYNDVSGPRLTLAYCLQALNIIDFLAIAPFYAELAFGAAVSIPVLRVLRLIRVFRLFKAPKLRACADMFVNIVIDAIPALMSIGIMTIMLCMIVSSCIVFAEGSWYSVEHFTDSYPDGVYIRPTADGRDVEPSPFTSILYAFWWFYTTATTVGYGDDYPTTPLGRVIAVFTFYAGIFLVALPLTVIGGSFNKFYPAWMKEFQTTIPSFLEEPPITKSSRLVDGSEKLAIADACVRPQEHDQISI